MTRDGVVLSYELRGRLRRRGRPWVVLIAGLGFDRHGWHPVVAGLGGRFRLVLLDNRGVGRSDQPPGPYSVAEMARDVVAVLDAAEIDRAHVVGTSLGGMVAQELAIGYPERVDRLVLVATTPGWPFGYPFPATNAWMLSHSSRRPPEVARRQRVEYALSQRTVRERPQIVDRIVSQLEESPPGRDPWREQAAAGARYTNRGRAGNIRARTLVVHGSDDAVVDPRNAALLAAAIPDADLAVLPGAGHLLFWEQPDEFVSTVARFLEASPVRGAAGARAYAMAPL